jgi:hypothetical protein
MRTQPTPRYLKVYNTGPLDPCMNCGFLTNLGYIVRGKDLGKDNRICSERCADVVYGRALKAEAEAYEAKVQAGVESRRAAQGGAEMAS